MKDEEIDHEYLKSYYLGKLNYYGRILIIKIPRELSNHKKFPLIKEKQILVIAKDNTLIIKNIKP